VIVSRQFIMESCRCLPSVFV